jgi:peptide/nickel transport system substrate-binding protein
MGSRQGISRRHFLRLSALTAAGTVIAACSNGGGGSSGGAGSSSGSQLGGTVSYTKTDIKYDKGLTYTGKYNEAPMLADLVKQGKLPSVDKRLPAHPYVVPHDWVKEGKYGGTMNWVVSDTTDTSTYNIVCESMYGHSPLRWLNDGNAIGPGLVQSWETNTDLSLWTLHFRKGLKWSDGHDWTVDDILFFWEDEVGEPALAVTAPQELRSGKGTPVQMKKIDNYTLQLQYDSPTPLAADFAAMWTKRSIGPRWMDPKHYLSQFHIKYNKSLDPVGWVQLFLDKQMHFKNPDNPTMSGFRLLEYKQGQYTRWERNPYYYVIDRWGNQLPYMDHLVNTNYQDAQAMRLAIQQGRADFVNGYHIGLTLGDVAGIKSGQSQNDLQIQFWDDGGGAVTSWFFNYDHQDQKLRTLFRNAQFRQALSLATNRANIRKVVHYGQGELSTGTMSPKAVEFHVGDGPNVYKQWRDAYVDYNPTKAQQLLDSIGVKQASGGQWRTLPDGSPLEVTLDQKANAPDYQTQKNELLAKDWQAVGINARVNPVNPTAFNALWASGQIQTTADWGVGDGPNCLVYANWIVPLDNARWAPLEGQWFLLQGTAAANQQQDVNPWKRTPPNLMPDSGGPVDRLQKLYPQALTEPDFLKRNQVVWEIAKIHTQEGPFFSAVVANTPQVVGHRSDMRNVPTRDDLTLHGFTGPWIIPCPAVYDMEAFFWSDPSKHTT